jgi:hypothetical protein
MPNRLAHLAAMSVFYFPCFGEDQRYLYQRLA